MDKPVSAPSEKKKADNHEQRNDRDGNQQASMTSRYSEGCTVIFVGD